MTSAENDDQAAVKQLTNELQELADPGLRRLPAALALPLLKRVVRALSTQPNAPLIEQITETLKIGSSHLAEVRRTAVESVLDFGSEAGASTLTERREVAAKALDRNTEYFLRNLEKPLLEELARHLLRLLAEADARGVPAGNDTPPIDDTEPTSERKPELPRRSYRRMPTRWIAVVAGCLLLAAVGVAIEQASSTPKHHLPPSTIVAAQVIPGDCSRTTAELFDPYVKTRAVVARSELYMAVPNERSPDTRDGWVKVLEYGNIKAHLEIIHTAEVRQFALSYHNNSGRTADDVIAKLAFPPGAVLLPSSVCLYTHAQYRYGTRYTGTSLVRTSGLDIGSYRQGESAYLTFLVQLPDVRHLSCGRSEVAFYGKAGTEGLSELNWDQNASGVVIHFERRC